MNRRIDMGVFVYDDLIMGVIPYHPDAQFAQDVPFDTLLVSSATLAVQSTLAG
jgi:hypothetical protein